MDHMTAKVSCFARAYADKGCEVKHLAEYQNL